MGNLKYVVQDDNVLISYLGKTRKVRLTKHHSVKELIHFISINTDKIFGINQDLSGCFFVYKVGKQLFRLPQREEESLKRFFPNVMRLSTKKEKLLKQNLLLNHLEGSYYVKFAENHVINQLQEGISIYHVLDRAETELTLPTINRFLDINILKNIYFESLIEAFDIINNQGKCIIKIRTPEKEIYNFEDTNIGELIFKAVKGLMESELSYDSIGIGRSKEESYKDFLNKHDNDSEPIYCQDSLAQHLGLVLTKR
ncbi:hypothetical protein B279_02670 [Streptococcus equinus ATCC 33317]|uniref:hypothetical protein n=1 Tax=Streptococcus equinus TaxID=1335 RepID=UPI000500080E|nr:hypothetical protein [Streptococcus equinus]KFN86827.1 hypothetical protein B279_02670 [Streptococcus equinus ATCC 33317]